MEQSIDRHESSYGDADGDKKTGMSEDETHKLVEVFLV